MLSFRFKYKKKGIFLTIEAIPMRVVIFPYATENVSGTDLSNFVHHASVVGAGNLELVERCKCVKSFNAFLFTFCSGLSPS